MTQEELEAAGVPPGEFYAPGWHWDEDATPEWARGVISAALSDIGKREVGSSNDGPDLAKFKTHGNPWCALAVSEWFREGLLDRGCPWGVIASAVGFRDWGVSHRLLVRPENVQPGDIGVHLRDRDPVTHEQHGHVWIIVSCIENGGTFTVEGNSANACRGGIRPISSLTVAIRPIT